MSVEVSYTVYCDQCGAWGAEGNTLKEARSFMTEDGWQQEDEHDYCPFCWAKKQGKGRAISGGMGKGLKAENEQLRQQLVSLDYKLHALTPMGSEFANNADRCIQWIEQQLSSRLAACVRATAARDQAIAEASEYRKILEQWVEKIEWKFKDDGSKDYTAFVHELLTREKAAEEATRAALGSTTLAGEHLARDRERDVARFMILNGGCVSEIDDLMDTADRIEALEKQLLEANDEQT